jgi:hypothetical protein
MEWQSIETAPKDGSMICAAYYNNLIEYEDGVYWQTEGRCCMLGSRAGSLSSGWTSSEIGLPVEGITHWRPSLIKRSL